MTQRPITPNSIWSRLSLWGSILLWYFWCMTLPLVGKAGSQTAHARANLISVAALLFLSLLCSLVGGWELKAGWGSGSRQKWAWGLWTGHLCICLILLFIGALGI